MNMSIELLARKPVRPRAELALTDQIAFARGRVHEFCGPARRVLAVLAAARTEGPILWIRPGWAMEQVSADGMAPHFNPARIVFVDVIRTSDILWCMEEALRTGAAPVVIAEVTDPPALTPVRRLHLAAEAADGAPVLPILLSPEEGGAQGVESRWHICPCHGPATTAWTITRLRARLNPPASWTLSYADATLTAA